MNAPSPRRAATVLGVCLVLMLAYLFSTLDLKPTPAITWVSAITSVLVLAPSVVSFFWPHEGAPGEIPYHAVEGWFLAGIACCSLPLYAVLAGIQVAIGVHMRIHDNAGTVSMLHATGPLAFLGLWFTIAALPALAEEMLFRGIIQQTTVAQLGARWGIVAAAGVFSFLHADLLGFLPRLLMGLWFGYLFWRSGSLWSSTIAHMLNNTWGLVMAQVAGGLETHLTVVGVLSLVALALGVEAFRRAGVWGTRTLVPVTGAGPEVPYLVAVHRPDPPRPLEERPPGEARES